MSCRSCGDNSTDSAELPLPSGATTEAVSVVETPAKCTTTTSTTTCPVPEPVKQLCSTIKTECGCEPPVINPLAKLSNTLAFAMPGCSQSVEVLFDKDVSGLMPGLDLYGVDASSKTIRLKIVSVNPTNKLVLRNECSSCCPSSKPVGEVVLVNTAFTWGIPQCCSTGQSVQSNDCLVGTFFFPASGATSPANVQNAFSFAVGGLYSMGGFIWKVAARVTSTQLLLENPAPGNGSVVGGFLDGGCEGTCVYPITPIAESDICNDSAVANVALVGCTPSGQRKLASGPACGLVTQDASGGTFSVKPLFNGSASTGPHYIEYDAANPCNTKLVYAPDLAGADCATTSCALYLSPANQGEYEVEVSTTGPFTTIAPNNIVTIGNRQYTVTAIVNGGTPGKLRVRPRFPITVSETIPAQTKVCVETGCQAFPSSQWPYGCDINVHGVPVYCANDGLRTYPLQPSSVNSTDFSNSEDVNISALGSFLRPEVVIDISNPSPCRGAFASGTISCVYQLRLADDGEWFLDNLLNFDAAPTVAQPSIQVISFNGLREFFTQVVTPFAVSLGVGQTRQLRFAPRVRCTNASANSSCRLRGVLGRIVQHVTSS